MYSLKEAFNRRGRGDEFYTKSSKVEREMAKYNFSGMIVYCNCDNPESSAFVSYFRNNFQRLGIQGLIATFNGQQPFLYEFDGFNERKTPIRSGRFEDNLNLLNKCDVVVTNPPFSNGLALKLMSALISSGKKFVIVAPLYLVARKPVFNYIRNGQIDISAGISGFDRPNGADGGDFTAYWWTNMGVRKPQFVPRARYDERLYPKYDNADAIEVGNVNNIPCDYDGYMGVPLNFAMVYNPSQFELVKLLYHPIINGRRMMTRLIIRRK